MMFCMQLPMGSPPAPPQTASVMQKQVYLQQSDNKTFHLVESLTLPPSLAPPPPPRPLPLALPHSTNC